MSAKVSTIVPAFNAERTIARAIDSALAQRFEGHEIIVVNDGSTDSTAATLKNYGNRVRVITRPNGGLSAARNAGADQSNAEYIALLDSDDIWLPGKLRTMISALERNPLASLGFGEYGNINDFDIECGGSSIGHAPTMKELMVKALPAIVPSTWVMRRKVLERTGGFCEAFKGAGGFDDSWMLLLLHELGDFEYVSEKLTLYRIGDSSKSADKYGRGLPIFIDLVKKRYGSRGKALIRNAKNLQCRWMLSKVAHQMNSGDRRAALATLRRIARLRPAYFLSSELRLRLILPQNQKRVRDLCAIPGRYRSQS